METPTPTQYVYKATASVVIILLALINSGCDGRGVGNYGSTNAEFIRSSCSTTIYPKLCYSSLSAHAAAVQQNPKLLASAALSVSLATAVSASAAMVKLSHAAGLTPHEAGAMRDCVEELADSVDQLGKTMAEMTQLKKGGSGSDFERIMSDAQTWVSAALTDVDTCMEGFAGKLMNGGVKAAVRGKIVNVAHMTSNALSLINTYASSLHG